MERMRDENMNNIETIENIVSYSSIKVHTNIVSTSNACFIEDQAIR